MLQLRAGHVRCRSYTNDQALLGRSRCCRQSPRVPGHLFNSTAAAPAPLASGLLPAHYYRRSVLAKVARPGSAPADDASDPSNVPPASSSEPPVTADVSSSPTSSIPAVSPAAEPDAGGAAATYAAASEGTGPSESTPTAASVTGAGAGTGASGLTGGGGGAAAQSTVALTTRFNGIGYTFVLAGFLKIVTMGGLVMSAPVDAARTAFGKASPYLMVPIGLGMCWVAKQVVDTGLNESRRFMQYMVATLVLLYFALVKLMYKYEPDSEWVRRPRPRLPGQLADLRAELGDKDLLGSAMGDTRSYMLEKPGKELYDDVAWYEGRYPSQMNGAGTAEGARRGRGSAVARLDARRAVAAATETDDDYGAAVSDILRARESGLGGEPDSAPAPAVARVANRRSFLTDNTR